jgi:hypothetical protein
MISLLLSALLAQATPSLDGTPGAASPPAAAATTDSDSPKGAPAGDYDFVAWCHGALAGHMALYEQVKSELVSIEQPGEVETDEKNDKLQMAAGREYLALYTHALNTVDKAHPGRLAARRKADEAQGAAIWDPYKDVAPRQRMWAWVGWDLPGRCETASHKLETRKGMAEALAAPAPAAGPSSIDDALGATAPPPARDAAAPQVDGPPAPAPQ